jgi:hypothetical protein
MKGNEMLNRLIMWLFACLGSFLVPVTSAFAAIDTSAIDDALTDVGMVGAAVFAVFVAIAVFRYVRRIL